MLSSCANQLGTLERKAGTYQWEHPGTYGVWGAASKDSMKALLLVMDKALESPPRDDFRLPENDARNSVAMETFMIWWVPLLKNGETPGEWQAYLWALRKHKTSQANIRPFVLIFAIEATLFQHWSIRTFANGFENVSTSYCGSVRPHACAELHLRHTNSHHCSRCCWDPGLWPGHRKPPVCRYYGWQLLD